MTQVAPYGSWKSPISSDLIVSETIKFEQVVLDGSDIYWIEKRPTESGRCVIVRRTSDGNITDMLPPPYNARTSVHEYGGRRITKRKSTIYFSNFSDQHLYRLIPGSTPQPVAFAEHMRYADYVIDHRRNRIICVREDHTLSEHEPANTLVSVSLDGSGKSRVLVSGNDFFSSPRLSPDGSRLAWLTWNHPNMPWDCTELCVGKLGEDGSILQPQRIVGNTGESIFQPQWSPDGVLHFVSDRTGWWNLYRCDPGTGGVRPLCPREAEFGQAQWVFGQSTYAFLSSEQLVCTYSEGGRGRLARLDIAAGQLVPIEVPYSDFGGIRVAAGRILCRAGSPADPPSVVAIDPANGAVEVLRQSAPAASDDGLRR